MGYGIRYISGINEGLWLPIAEGRELTMGRATSNDLVMPADAWVSNKHATLKRQNSRIFIKDLNSTNGTFTCGNRIKPDSYQPVEDLFVVGSTLFKITEKSHGKAQGPIPIDEAILAEFEDNPLFQAARRRSRSRPILNAQHLFLALLEVHGQALASFLEALNLPTDPEIYQKQVDHHKIFRREYDWLNHFLSMSRNAGNGDKGHLTPLVANLLEIEGGPTSLLQAFLGDGFNLVFPLLRWQSRERRWPRLLDKLNTPKEAPKKTTRTRALASVPAYLSPLMGMNDFWHHLGDMVAGDTITVVAGSRGCGKSAAMRFAIHLGCKRDLPASLSGKVHFFDPKAFIYFYSSEKLDTYLNHLIRSIKSRTLTIIDHFDKLLEHMAQQNHDKSLLLEAIDKTRYPPILVMGKNLDMLYQYQGLGTAQIVDMDQYLACEIPKVIDILLLEFQERVKVIVGDDGRRFFHSKIAAREHHNIRRLHEINELAIRRARHMDHSLAQMPDETTAFGQLGGHCFQEVWDAFHDGRAEHEPVEAQPLPAVPDDTRRESETTFIEQVEALFHNFSKTNFKTPLNYSDRTSSLKQQGKLEREAKLQELKEQLVRLIATFQAVFPAWFEDFWLKVDPEMIAAEIGGNNARKFWNAFLERTRNIDAAYAEDLFHQKAREILQKSLSGR